MKLTHPDTEQVIEVHPNHAEAYTSQGWVVPAEKPEPAK